MKDKNIAVLTIYGLQTMTTKEYRRLMNWLEEKFEESKKPNYRKEYANKYVSRLIKQSPTLR